MRSAAKPGRSLPGGGSPVDSTRIGGGAGAAGMWWVAWRQHRLQLAVSLGVLTVVAATLLIFRTLLVNRISELGGGSSIDCGQPGGIGSWGQGSCPEPVYAAIQGEFGTSWALFQMGVLVLPLVLGAFVGAPMFAREYEQHTQIWALTQSVSRTRWWACKVIVGVSPVVLAMVGIGLMMEWAAAPFVDFSSSPMDDPGFEISGIIPAAFTLLATAIGITAGIFLRSTVIALVVTLITAGILVGAVAVLRPHLLTPERLITPVQLGGTWVDSYPDIWDWHLGSGYLDATGLPVTDTYTGNCPGLDNSSGDIPAETADRLWAQCQAEKGIVSEYVDYLPAERRATLQLAVTGIIAFVTAVILAAGLFRLRRRIL